MMRRHVSALGLCLEGRVEIVEENYRNITASYDAFVSVGQYAEFGRLARLSLTAERGCAATRTSNAGPRSFHVPAGASHSAPRARWSRGAQIRLEVAQAAQEPAQQTPRANRPWGAVGASCACWSIPSESNRSLIVSD